MNADGLSRIAMSSGLAASLSRATDYARSQGHAEVRLEHMLLALCDDPDAVLVLAASNINVAELTGEIGGQLAAVPTGQHSQDGELAVAADLRRILEAAAAAARGGRRREINGAIVLAAIIGDGKSTAAHILSRLGLTFEGAIRALQSKPAPAPEPSARPLPPTDAESILANARERVQSRTVTAPPRRLPPPEEPAYEEPPQAYEEPRFEPPSAPEPEFPEPYPQPMPAAVQSPAPPARSPPAAQPSASPAYREAEPQFEPPHGEPAFDTYGAPPTFEGDGYAPDSYDNSGPSGLEAVPFEAHGDQGYDFGPPPMPASPPYPPPVPAPSPHEGWAPPPSLSPARPRQNLAPPRNAPPAFQSAPDAPRPGPPPLAPWPEPGLGFGGGAPGGPAAGSLPGYEPSRPMPPAAQPTARGAGRGVSSRVEIGQLVENIPRSMRVAVPAMIEVRIARADVRALAEGLQGGGAAYQHEVTVTKAMSVRLRAPDGGFFIETASPETQWIEKTMLLSSDDFASWRWHVTPRDKGRRRLQLIISARTVSADGLAAETALPDQVITVRVRANYGRSAKRGLGWVIAAVAGGVLAKFGEGAFEPLVRLITG